MIQLRCASPFQTGTSRTTLWISDHIGYVVRHLHKVGLHIESCLTRSGTTDDNHILISGILWCFWSAVHGQTFRFCEDDIVFKDRIHEGFNIFSISPSGRSILHTLSELLCIF